MFLHNFATVTFHMWSSHFKKWHIGCAAYLQRKETFQLHYSSALAKLHFMSVERRPSYILFNDLFRWWWLQFPRDLVNSHLLLLLGTAFEVDLRLRIEASSLGQCKYLIISVHDLSMVVSVLVSWDRIVLTMGVTMCIQPNWRCYQTKSW